LKVTVEVTSRADGSLSGARVVKGSGSREFDNAVLDAIKRVRMPARPDKKTETVQFDFSMRDRGEG
jgi:TonB family protein